MARVCEKVILSADIERVWELLTSYDKYPLWRSDLKMVDVVGDKYFMETSTDNKRLMFYIIKSEPCSLLTIDFKNDILSGSWTGRLRKDNEKTVIDITEELYTKKLLLRPFIKGYLKKQQAVFIEDMKRALE